MLFCLWKYLVECYFYSRCFILDFSDALKCFFAFKNISLNVSLDGFLFVEMLLLNVTFNLDVLY